MSLDLAYNNVDFIPNGADYPEKWATEAHAFRSRETAIGRARLNLAYGPGERQKLDLFLPAGKAQGLVVFVHGGYWLKFDRTYWSQFAQGLTASDWAVAMPSYTLAPAARISQITQEIAQAIAFASDLQTGPIRLAGHSAGGHLVARMLCRDVVLSDGIRDRIEHVVPLSPVSDLRPLLDLTMNDGLRLDPAEAEAESPMRHPKPATPVTVWVGAEERPVFLDQAMWLAEAWNAPLRLAAGCHHFDILDGLETADHPLTQSILG